MYYGGLDGAVWQLGFAYSGDGLSWTRSTRNPFLQNSPGFDSAALESAAFARTATESRLYYTASDGSMIRIGLAVKTGPELTSAPLGTFTSRIFDSGINSTTWRQAAWDATFPTGSTGVLSVRIGNSHVPDPSWSGWIAVLQTTPSADIPGDPPGRFIQYRIDMTAPSGTVSPEISSVTLTYGAYATRVDIVVLIAFVSIGVVAASFAVVAYFVLKPRRPRQPPVG